MIIITILLLHLQLISLHCLPNIELHEYQNQDINKTCSNALIAEKENVLFHGSVKFSSDSHFWNSLLTIQYNHSSTNYEFKHMCSVDTSTKDSVVSTNGCYCYSCSNENFKQFIITKIAKLEYSQAEIRAALHSTNGDIIYSPTRKLPLITNSGLDNTSKVEDDGDCVVTCNSTFSIVRLCCYGSCKPVIYNNGVKLNNSVGKCTELVYKPFEKFNLTFVFKDQSASYKPIIKSCINEYTVEELKLLNDVTFGQGQKPKL
ncbi:uncharacterized protein LOC131943839 [Physella acuta]|uniref:uncharacterized protein LOC131943839 n=1 Tax=Physella acuta TaxID=109671 RepID=UPI0027DE127C|nr:uncharacterized protein LOC131943839 [Physella acuta]